MVVPDGLVAWCEKHRSRFLEKHPSERSLCLYSLYEDNYTAMGWEDCAPVRARVVTEKELAVSDEWLTVEEQVVAEAVAPFVKTVGDAVEAATAVLEALRGAGFDVYVDRLRADGWTECGTCGGSGKVDSSCSDQCDYQVACPDCVDGRVPGE